LRLREDAEALATVDGRLSSDAASRRVSQGTRAGLERTRVSVTVGLP